MGTDHEAKFYGTDRGVGHFDSLFSIGGVLFSVPRSCAIYSFRFVTKPFDVTLLF